MLISSLLKAFILFLLVGPGFRKLVSGFNFRNPFSSSIPASLSFLLKLFWNPHLSATPNANRRSSVCVTPKNISAKSKTWSASALSMNAASSYFLPRASFAFCFISFFLSCLVLFLQSWIVVPCPLLRAFPWSLLLLHAVLGPSIFLFL